MVEITIISVRSELAGRLLVRQAHYVRIHSQDHYVRIHSQDHYVRIHSQDHYVRIHSQDHYIRTPQAYHEQATLRSLELFQ